MITTPHVESPEVFFQANEAGLHCVGAFWPGGGSGTACVELNGRVTLLALASDDQDRQQTACFYAQRGDRLSFRGPAGIQLDVAQLASELVTKRRAAKPAASAESATHAVDKPESASPPAADSSSAERK